MQGNTRHYADFLSPGTFISEDRRVPLETGWNVPEAIAKAKKIEERYEATPYGFCFVTMLEADDIEVEGHKLKVQSKELKRSGFYFLTGTVRSAAEILAGTDPREDILRGNVRGNGLAAVVVNTNSYKTTQPFEKDDVVVDLDGRVIAYGHDYTFPDDLKD